MRFIRFIDEELLRTNAYLHKVQTNMDSAFDYINDIRYNKLRLNNEHQVLV